MATGFTPIAFKPPGRSAKDEHLTARSMRPIGRVGVTRISREEFEALLVLPQALLREASGRIRRRASFDVDDQQADVKTASENIPTDQDDDHD
jgi:hypothetical protein